MPRGFRARWASLARVEPAAAPSGARFRMVLNGVHMKSLIALALALGTATLVACEAKEPSPQEPAKEAPEGQVVTLAITGMT